MLIDRLRYGGGAERLCVGLATSLPRDRYEVTVCTTRRSAGGLLDALDASDLQHFSLGRGDGLDPLAFRRLAAFLRRERIDVLHAHKFGSNVWGAALGAACRIPVTIAHEHGSHPATTRRRRLLERRLIGRFADAIVVGSRADRDNLVGAIGIPPHKVVVIPGAYIPHSGTGEDLRAELHVDPEALLIGTVAVLRPEKAIEVLIDAFATLAPALPKARLVIAGNGPERTRLEDRAAVRGIRERAHFLGWRSDVGVVLAGLDVAVLSSDREGTSLFALECMAHRVPVVATDVGGPREILEHGVSALLVPPREPAALADAIRDLLTDPAKRRRLAARAAEQVGEFSLERAAERFAAVYERLLRKEAAVP